MVEIDENINIKIDLNHFVLEFPPNICIRLDNEGRWCSFRNGSDLYRRTLDGKTMHFDKNKYISCNENKEELVYFQILNFLSEFLKDVDLHLKNIKYFGERGSYSNLVIFLRKALLWKKNDYKNDRAQYNVAYCEPIPILPPDRYRNLVVLPAIGCPNAKCVFCAFYKNQLFKVFNKREFQTHLKKVLSFYGSSLNSRKGVFLGSASALSLSQKKILEFINEVKKMLGPRFSDFAAFQDPDHVPLRDTKDFKDLLKAGLTHITIGLETGCASLRKKLGKSNDIDKIINIIQTQKNAGIRCGITVLVGIAQRDEKEDHINETVDVIKKMALNNQDIVYLSALLNQPEVDEEIINFKRKLSEVTTAKISNYCCDRFYNFS